jgi:hypothetical protein
VYVRVKNKGRSNVNNLKKTLNLVIALMAHAIVHTIPPAAHALKVIMELDMDLMAVLKV